MAEQCEHFARFLVIRADMTADKLVGMCQKILCQRHSAKITAVRKKANRIYPQKRGRLVFWGNTTGLVGKEKTPQLMVFLVKISADKHCEKWRLFLLFCAIRSLQKLAAENAVFMSQESDSVEEKSGVISENYDASKLSQLKGLEAVRK
ncbi:MAG TPA: hypothetical protein VK769_00200, partial [Verrucomicrobiae bacterium]|nr:hypothetical protein [Verrucomicrobiae bacterium]